jgi:hypothetical protein
VTNTANVQPIGDAYEAVQLMDKMYDRLERLDVERLHESPGQCSADGGGRWRLDVSVHWRREATLIKDQGHPDIDRLAYDHGTM